MPRRLTRRPSLALLGASLLLLTAGAVASADVEPSPDAALLSLFETPNTEFPEVAMTIGGQPISGQYLSYAVTQLMENPVPDGPAGAAAATLTRADAVQLVVDRLTIRDALSAEATRRGFVASEEDITAFLTEQTDAAVAYSAAEAAAVWAANGDADGAAYIKDPKVRLVAARMIATAGMLRSLRAADPSFDDRAFADQLKSSVKVELFFTP